MFFHCHHKTHACPQGLPCSMELKTNTILEFFFALHMCGGVRRWVAQENSFTEVISKAGVVAGAAPARADLRTGSILV